MNILFIGDIVGRLGRETVAKILPGLKKKHKIDLVIANAENAAHGSGVTGHILKELADQGVDAFSAGDHAFRNYKQIEVFDKFPIVRPANFPAQAPGKGFLIIEKGNKKILFASLIGQVFMNNPVDNPFIKINEILADKFLRANDFFAIIIDMHAETTSEKINMGHHLDGRVSAVLGTHTHIMTADARLSEQGTAYITDVGMVGAAWESIGVAKKGTLKHFLSNIKEPHVLPETGPAIFNSVLIKIGSGGKARSIKPISALINIK